MPKLNPWFSNTGCLLFFLQLFLGACFFNVTLPALIFCWHNNEFTRPQANIFNTLLGMHFLGAVLILPGAIVTSLASLDFLSKTVSSVPFNHTFRRSCIVGICLSMLNLPTWPLLFYLHQIHIFSGFQCVMLLLLAGASSGVWVSWLSWRVDHPNEPLIPRFSLLTLILIVLMFGLVPTIFQPNQSPTPSFSEIMSKFNFFD